MVNGGDKPVWPDPVRPCCIFTVSQGIAATVTAHQSRRDRNRERGNKGRQKKDGWKEGVKQYNYSKERFINIDSISARWKVNSKEVSPFPLNSSFWNLVCYKYELFTFPMRGKSYDFKSQLVSGRGGAE